MNKFFLILIFTGVLSIDVLSQGIQIKSFKKLNLDLVARIEPRLDLNGTPCALIKIISKKKKLQFDGNIIGEPVFRNGEIWLYMIQHSQRLKIKDKRKEILYYEFKEPLEKQASYEMLLNFTENTNNKLRVLVVPTLNFGFPQLSYGVMVGIVRRTGGYLKVINNFSNYNQSLSNVSSNRDENWYTGKVVKERLAGTAGVLQRLSASFYLYAGMGYGYHDLYWETVNQRLFLIREHSFSGFETELGGMYRINNLAVSLGVQTNSFKLIEGCLGVGIMF